MIPYDLEFFTRKSYRALNVAECSALPEAERVRYWAGKAVIKSKI